MGYGELGILRSSTLLMNRFSIELIIYDDSWDETHRIPMVHATRCLPLVVVMRGRLAKQVIEHEMREASFKVIRKFLCKESQQMFRMRGNAL